MDTVVFEDQSGREVSAQFGSYGSGVFGVGYNLYIHRADDWTHSDQHPITADEWLAVIASDPELRTEPGSREHFAVWTGSCRYPGGTWFDWSEGCVFTKNPDRAIVTKMLAVARQLGARVQGDHGEFYNRPEDMPSEEEFAAAEARVGRRSVPPSLALLGCGLTGLAALFVFVVGIITIWGWIWQ